MSDLCEIAFFVETGDVQNASKMSDSQTFWRLNGQLLESLNEGTGHLYTFEVEKLVILNHVNGLAPANFRLVGKGCCFWNGVGALWLWHLRRIWCFCGFFSGSEVTLWIFVFFANFLRELVVSPMLWGKIGFQHVLTSQFFRNRFTLRNLNLSHRPILG